MLFYRRLTNGGIFNSRVLFKNNGLSIGYCFLEICVGGEKTLMEQDKVVIGGRVPPLGKTLHTKSENLELL